MRQRRGVYVHLPFCPYLCPYCDFVKWPLRLSSARRYLAALHREIEEAEPLSAASFFLGGGTPNTYHVADICELLAHLQRHFPSVCSTPREISIEVNPELVRDEDFAAYRLAGVTRLSIGVQSFVPEEIAILGRKHTPTDPQRVVHLAREAGFASVSIDLMFGVPGQTPRTWATSLDAAIALDIDHCSTYGLTVEEQTRYFSWREREPAAFMDDEREAELYDYAMDRLASAGFEQYEISNFARGGARCAHNENYWSNGEYLGLGVGAASYLAGVRRVQTRSLAEYLEAVESGSRIPAQEERLDGLARVGEAVMLALRTAQGVDSQAFKERYDIEFEEQYRPVIARLIDQALLECHRQTYRLTRRGRMLANPVCAEFLA